MQQQEALPTQPKGHTLFRKDARGLTQTQRVLVSSVKRWQLPG